MRKHRKSQKEQGDATELQRQTSSVSDDADRQRMREHRRKQKQDGAEAETGSHTDTERQEMRQSRDREKKAQRSSQGGSETGEWTYRMRDGVGIMLREEPSVDAAKTGKAVDPSTGDMAVVERITEADGQVFLRLQKGGWLFVRGVGNFEGNDNVELVGGAPTEKPAEEWFKPKGILIEKVGPTCAKITQNTQITQICQVPVRTDHSLPLSCSLFHFFCLSHWPSYLYHLICTWW